LVFDVQLDLLTSKFSSGCLQRQPCS